jgi:hypothetical protein
MRLPNKPSSIPATIIDTSRDTDKKEIEISCKKKMPALWRTLGTQKWKSP